MALIPSDTAPTGGRHVALAERRPGPDVARAVALIGVVVMNFHGYLFFDDPRPGDWWLADLLHPVDGPLSTRFAATFVLVAGVGVTLMTRRSVGDAGATSTMRARLVRRGVVLLVVGIPFDELWPGTILPYYGVFFVLAAAIFTWSTARLVALGVGAVVAAWLVHWWILERVAAGRDMRWITAPSSLLGRLVFDLGVSGTHPVLPWLGFFCAGIVLGRWLRDPRWRLGATRIGLALLVASVAVAIAVDHGVAGELASAAPYSRSPTYVASALATTLLAYVVIDVLAERRHDGPVVDTLQRVGQMSLSLYLLHAFVFVVVVDELGWITPSGVDTSLGFAIAYWVLASAAAVAWSTRFGRGPFERLYRAITD